MPSLGNCQTIQDRIDQLQAEIDTLSGENSPTDRAQIQRQIEQDRIRIIALTRQLEHCLLSPHVPANLLLVSGEANALSMKDEGGSPRTHVRFDLFNPNSSPVNITHSYVFIMAPGGWKVAGDGSRLVSGFQIPTSIAPQTSSVGEGILPSDPEGLPQPVSHLALVLHAEGSSNTPLAGYCQDLLAQAPVGITPETDWSQVFVNGGSPDAPSQVPALMPIQAPVFIAAMERLRLIRVGAGYWLPVIGLILNGSGRRIQITSFKWEFMWWDENGNPHTKSGDFLPRQFVIDFFSNPRLTVDLVSTPSDHDWFGFSQSIELDLFPPTPSSLTLRCSYLDYSPSTLPITRTVVREFDVEPYGGPQLIAPVKANGMVQGRMQPLIWNANNGPQKNGFNGHNNGARDRFSLDLQLRVGDFGSDTHGQPLVAMASGKIVEFRDSNSPDDNNIVVIQHADNFYSLYYHIQQNSVHDSFPGIPNPLGLTVDTGTQIAKIGNPGGGAHLHVTFYQFDSDGTFQSRPLSWSNITDQGGAPLFDVTNNMNFKVV